MNYHTSRTLFEIPIYSMSEKKFNQRWYKKGQDFFNKLINRGHSKEEARQHVITLNYPKYLWQYNQIIGYIKISVTKTDVFVDLFCIQSGRLFVDSPSRRYIINQELNGYHFYADNLKNHEIKQNIKSLLKSIKKEHLNGKYYIDCSTFNNIFDYVDITDIMYNL